MAKLITELYDTVCTLVEGKEGEKKRWIIEGIWMQANRVVLLI